MIHCLKIEENYLANLLDEKKLCEIRYNDRDYQVGDILEFKRYGIKVEEFSFVVTHIHSGLGLKEGFVALSVKRFSIKLEVGE